MRANKVIKILKISRSTLSRYTREGKIKASFNPITKRYDYDAASVQALLLQGKKNISGRKERKL